MFLFEYIRLGWFGLQFRLLVSETFNGNSAQSVKESVPGANMEVKQDVTGEFFGLLILFCMLRRILFCFCCNYVYFRDLWLLLLMKLLIYAHCLARSKSSS
jgi:hypothetical protein